MGEAVAVTNAAKQQESAAESGAGLGEAREAREARENERSAEAIPETLLWQTRARRLYNNDKVQLGIALLIFFNFLVSAVEKQVLAQEGTEAFKTFNGFEIFFVIVFGVELVWNIYAHWFRYFWASGWNVFDFAIVTISFISMSSATIPGITILRLFRAFRVFRLFRRIESLKVIIEGVGAAAPGVANAFMILGIIMGIWSIIGVEFFSAYADEEFGSFLKAMFTMWQVMTLDGWASSIARPLLYDDGQIVAAPFFISFTFVASIVMTNVVVAILLDKYLGATAALEARKEKAAQALRTAALLEQTSFDITAAAAAAKRGERFLDKADLIQFIAQTLKRKNLQNLAKDDIISLSLLVWQHPSMRDFVPEQIAQGQRLDPESQSRSILLNVMQRGLFPNTPRLARFSRLSTRGGLGAEPSERPERASHVMATPRRQSLGL